MQQQLRFRREYKAFHRIRNTLARYRENCLLLFPDDPVIQEIATQLGETEIKLLGWIYQHSWDNRQ